VEGFGRQPALDLVLKRYWTMPDLAQEINVNKAHLYNALYGRTRPSDELRERLPRLLKRELTDLFTPEALAKPYSGSRTASRWARHRRLREELAARQ
jgi:transcriptional regulator with XRE-family HTH domain